MKRKKISLGGWKVSIDRLHWMGFSIAALIIISITAYGFSLSLRPNSFTLDSAPESSLATVGVALANNVGTDTSVSRENPVNLVQDVALVQDALISEGVYEEGFFEDHFPRISQLTELVNIDVVNYLRLHPDKLAKLESYVNQLEEKKGDAQEALATLSQLNALHMNAIPGIEQEIASTQVNIEGYYNNRDGNSIVRSLSRLEELRIEQQEHKNIVVFTNRIALEYRALIAAADQKITVLRANVGPLVQGVTVKLPVGIDINVLKNLKIFATETK